jgi:hypothetical protein
MPEDDGLVDDAIIQEYFGAFAIDPLYPSSPNCGDINLEKLAEAKQKVTNTAGCGIFKEGKLI